MGLYSKIAERPNVAARVARARERFANASDEQIVSFAVDWYLMRLLLWTTVASMMVDIAAHWLK